MDDGSLANTGSPLVFGRDRLTFLAYALAGIFAYTEASLGPAMPLLRNDLRINRTIGGLHFTMIAFSSLIAGFFVDRSARRWGRRRVVWAGSAAVAMGGALIGVASHPAVSLAGAVLIGGPGSALLSAVRSALCDRHAAHRAVVLTESTTVMGVGTVVPGLLIGGLVALGAGWRPVMAIPLVLWVAAYGSGRTVQFPPPHPSPTAHHRKRLPSPYWLFWGAMIPAVAAEWMVAAWGAGYLVDVGGTSAGAASLLMTTYFGAITLGRLGGGWLARRSRPLPLLVSSATVALAGITLFWAAESPPVIVTGLMVCGLGVSLLFPMLLTMAVETAPDRSDVATARLLIATGGAVLIAPLSLGVIADATGIRTAFGLIPGLFLLVALLARLGDRLYRRATGTPQYPTEA